MNGNRRSKAKNLLTAKDPDVPEESTRQGGTRDGRSDACDTDW